MWIKTLGKSNYSRYHIDLIGDYAGSEYFVIDGSSLISHVLSERTIELNGQADSELRIDFEPGFQLLHAVYAVESFLEHARRRRCTFGVVFLESSAYDCVPAVPAGCKHPWKYLYLREVIIQHLKAANPDVVHVFESFDDEKFRDFLETTRPLFVLCGNGENIIVPAAEEEEEEEEREGDVEKEGEDAESFDEIPEDEGFEEMDEPETDPSAVEDSKSVRDWMKYKKYSQLRISKMWGALGFNIALLNTLRFHENKVRKEFPLVLQY